jgi:hypothetical protein
LDGANRDGLIAMADVMDDAHRDGWGNGCGMGWLMRQHTSIAGLGFWMAAARATAARATAAVETAAAVATVACLVVSNGCCVTAAALALVDAADTTVACC